MKLKNILKITFILLAIIILIAILPLLFTVKSTNKSISLNDEQKLSSFVEKQSEPIDDVYDVILFFGQSNMVGSMSQGIETRYQLNNSDTVKTYSSQTGIAEDIINQSWVTNYTITDVEPNTVYEYHVLTNSLYDLSDLESNGYTANGANITTNKYNGELLYYDYNTYKFYGRWSTDRPAWINQNSFSFSNAYGTNMTNEFAKQYYEKTGHKVVCVNAALGGQPLERFSPNVTYQDSYGTTINLYAGMSNKYLAAIRYLENNNLKIGNKFFVMFQGENEAGQNSVSIISSYKNNFQKIKSQLYQDLGINKGAIVLTGFCPGLYNEKSYALGVKSVNQAQMQLINENPDIILGSDFPFKHYVPGESDYNNTTLYSYKNNMNGADYNTALANAKLVVGNEEGDNLFHFTAAALAQIGRETAINMANSMVKGISALAFTLEQNLYTYDGTAKTPKVTVKDGNTILTSGVDYILTYANNINAGTATVTITGKGSYTGSKQLTFEIGKAQIVAEISGYNGIYDGQNHGINITVQKPQTGATIKYGTTEGNYTLTTSPTYKDVGTYTVYYQITAPNYEAKTGHAQIQILNKNINDLTITLKQTQYFYDGTAKTPEVIVKDGNIILTKDEHYVVSYSNNINAGTATVTITGQGAYTGNKQIAFEIEKAQIVAELTGYNGMYDGQNHGINITVQKPQTGATIKYGTTEGNYTLTTSPTYKNVGTYTVYYQITAPNYEIKTGSTQLEINKKDISSVTAILKVTSYTYDGKEKTPEVEIKDGLTILTKDLDYIVNYSNNINVGMATVTIEGKGNYEGIITKHFEIKKESETQKPDENEKPDDTNKPDENEKPDDTNKPDKDENPDDINKPDENENPDDTNKPNENQKPDDTNKPNENQKPDDTNKPNENQKPDNINKPSEDQEPDDINKSNENQKNEETNKSNTNQIIEENKNNTTIAPKIFPKTGITKSFIIIIGITVTIGISVICFIKYKKWNI